jgi:uncharacterized Ntn-hydrolase superfamily protein
MSKMSIIIFVSILFTASILPAQSINGEPLTHTYSIVARDEATGDLGVAVQSHWFSVGSIVSWAEAGVGAIATQSLVNVSFGPKGLDLLKQGKNAQETLEILLAEDEGRDFRQVAIIDLNGNVAVHTGTKCIADAGHVKGDNYSVQANMMLNKKIWPAMSQAFEQSTGPLAERMLAALQAAEAAGGDIRGRQSAAILVVRGKASGKIWEDRIIDLRVEDHPNAPEEIGRVLKVYRAYEHMNKGDLAIELGDEKMALEEYGAAQEMFPQNIEMQYWSAVSLVNIGQLEKALPMFKSIFQKDENWVELTRRIVKNGMLTADEVSLEKITTIHK